MGGGWGVNTVPKVLLKYSLMEPKMTKLVNVTAVAANNRYRNAFSRR